MSPVDTEDPEKLTEEANAARARLMRTVEALDHKAHDAVDVKLQVRRHLGTVVTVLAIAGIVMVSAIALVTYRIATHTARRRRERFLMLRRVWRHPERTARGDATTFWGRAFRSIALTIITAALGAPIRRALIRMLPEPIDRTRVAG